MESILALDLNIKTTLFDYKTADVRNKVHPEVILSGARCTSVCDLKIEILSTSIIHCVATESKSTTNEEGFPECYEREGVNISNRENQLRLNKP